MIHADRRWSRAAGLILGLLADRAFGDPERHHPVAALGGFASAVERVTYADTRLAGALHLGVVAAPVVGLSIWIEHRARGHVLTHIAATAAAVWAATGSRQLLALGEEVAGRLEAGDLDAARALIPSLVGRDPQSLDGPAMARATIESVAENTSDAAIGPLIWGAIGGVPGVVAHRVANTLDAMVGHRNARYRSFGTASARADDVLGLLPARVTALAMVLRAPHIGGARFEAWRSWGRDAHRHPSPNAGPVEAAAAGALGVSLGGETHYGDRVELRGPLGDGPPPVIADIRRTVHLARMAVIDVGVASALMTVTPAVLGLWRRRVRSSRTHRSQAIRQCRSST